jgi:uncharacterized OsmC-like protein
MQSHLEKSPPIRFIDLPCAALAAGQDSAVRMLADIPGVELLALEVQGTAAADARGATAMDRSVPAGCGSMACDVRLKAEDGASTDPLQRLQSAAERCCVVQQTLKSPPPVKTSFAL